MNIYTTKEASELLKVTKRTITNYCTLWKVEKFKGSYQITDQHLKEWKDFIGYDANEKEDFLTGKLREGIKEANKLLEEKDRILLEEKERKASEERKEIDLKRAIEIITIEAMNKDLQYRVFSNEEYNDVIGKLALVEQQEEHIRYLRNRIEKQDKMLQDLAKQIEQRNYIEVNEKGFNPKDKK